MRYHDSVAPTFKALLYLALISTVVAPPPTIPEWENLIYEIEGEVILDNQKTVVLIEGWDVHKGTRYPEPYDKLDGDLTWEFFQDDECRVENHPRFLVKSGVYEFPDSAKRRAGSFKIIDPLALRWTKDSRLTSIHEIEEQFIKTEEEWQKKHNHFQEAREKLVTGDRGMACPICHSELVERRPSKVFIGDCGHSYHRECIQGWVDSRNELGRDPAEFRERTGFPLAQMADCPQCRQVINPRTMARVTTQLLDGNNAPIIEPIQNNQASPSNDLPSILDSPGSELDDILYPHQMDERIRGTSRIKQPSQYNFQDRYLDVGKNALVDPSDYRALEVRESTLRQRGPTIRLPNNVARVSPLVDETDYNVMLSEAGAPDLDKIRQSLREGQLG
ncbi:hypothetical protein TWF694_000168 [Orbilia ellipsospora]|uniref:RING-type domain-containing protein n=1 Tax=Orbilia ellipsospora TaxID=2528407 RepID=A0AAV9XN89_9PEZI